MDKNQQKIKILEWKERLKKLEEFDLPQALKRVGEAAPIGDWHDNIEFEDAENQVELINIKIDEVRRIIRRLEKERG